MFRNGKSLKDFLVRATLWECLCDKWKPNFCFLSVLIFEWRKFLRQVTAPWWHQWAKDQLLTDQNSRNRWCQMLRPTICYPNVTRAVTLWVLLRPLPTRNLLKSIVVPEHVIIEKFSIYYNLKLVVKLPTLWKWKLNFYIRLIIIRINIEHLEKVIGKFHRNYFTLTIALTATAALKIQIL